MSTTIQTRLKKAGRLLPVALLPFLSFAAQAQTLNYAVAGATNVAGTYTDLGTTGTAIATANTDDANSAAQPIGFTFNFNGTAFTQFVLNTNGFIRLGAAAPSGTVLFPSQLPASTVVDPLTSSDPANTNLVMPFNQDLGPGTGTTGYRVATTGAAGSQVCTIQWSNVSDKTDGVIASQYANFSFQVKLYEGSNRVELVYNTATASTGAASARFPNVGIKGSGVANGQTVLASKDLSSSAWSTASFITGAYTTFTLNYRANVGPDAGRTFRFAPTVLLANDAAVTSLYTLGKVSATYSSPVTAQAVITNVGSTAQTNLPVTLTVSGATTYTNTQTVATLASGASTTVTFTYPVTATTGSNSVVVTIPSTDELPTNNTATATQAVTAADQSYIQGTTYTGGVGLSAAGNILAVRYTTTAASSPIKTVTPTFLGATAAGVTSTYQILIYSANAAGQPGTVLYTSPVQTRPTITGTTPTPAPVSIPGTVVSGTFFVALKTIGADNIGIGYQTESPLRAGTFFYTVDGTTWNDLNTQTISPRIGLDMAFGIASATKNDALAATVSLYPNPAHQSFQLSVPAGLRNASASLTNALGQVVQSRQLELPAAGGIVPFDVSRLAAGVYSLTLKSGNDLVVKRVVVE